MNLFCFEFDFLFFYKCEDVFNTALIVLAMSAIFGEILVWVAEYWWADCKGAKTFQGEKEKKKHKKTASLYFSICK